MSDDKSLHEAEAAKIKKTIEMAVDFTGMTWLFPKAGRHLTID